VEIYSNWIAILRSFFVAFVATLGTLLIHGFVVHTIVTEIRSGLRRGSLGVRLWGNLRFIGGVTLLAFAGHILEIVVWALVLDFCGAAADLPAALYCSAGDYTTLGPGDLVLPPQWRLLGPLEATTGMLMFGISTALIFGVIQRLVQARLDTPLELR